MKGKGMALPRRRRFLFLLCGAVLLAGAIYLLAGIPLHRALGDWRAGRRAAAIHRLDRWSALHLRPAEYQQLLAVVWLSAGRSDRAAPHLRAIAGRRAELFPPVRKLEVARALVSSGRYREFLEYDSSVHEWRESDKVALYRAAAQLGLGRIAESEATFSGIDPSSVEQARYNSLKGAIAFWKSGLVPYALDRGGRVIASLHVAEHELVAVDPAFASVVDRASGRVTFGARLDELGTASTLLTTLDVDFQRAALDALGSNRGAMVVIDTKTNEILAIASSPGEGPRQNLALEKQYEPGSIIKVLTTLNALEHHVNPSQIFPLDCQGYLILGGRQFKDWAAHGHVDDLNEAMADSCNVAFGKLGLLLGGDALRAFMGQAGFDGTVDLGLGPIPLGRTVGSSETPYDVASMAIGLQHESITALHVAILASMVANRGVLTTPRLFQGRRSILGEELSFPFSQTRTTLCSPASAQVAAEAMKAVVANPRGTGRRAVVDGLTIAMKTGTSGSAVPAYDCLIMAYAPAEAPSVAIGVIAENAGPAEFAGAKIAHDFFDQIRGRLSH
jgi:peptidoglycan glycosyltransferase